MATPKKSQIPSFSTWTEKTDGTVNITEFNSAMANFNEGLKGQMPIQRTEGDFAFYNSYRNLQTNTSGRTPFTRQNYNFFRPGEAVPTRYKEILAFVLDVYRRVPIVHQIIDLMGDFSTKGIRLVHQNPETQAYYEKWWEKVRGKHISERIVNNLLKLGTIYLRRYKSKLTEKQQKQIYRAISEEVKSEHDIQYVDIETYNPDKNEIPLRYSLYSPLQVEDISGALGAMTGKPRLVLSIPEELKKRIAKPSPQDRELIKQLPKDILDAARAGGKILLPPDKMSVLYYKKDEWDEFAFPMIYPILNDVVILDKMKLADQTALDGIISKVRVWKLGSLEYKIVPGPDAINAFSEFLMNNVGGGAMDIVYGPAIDLLETTTNSDSILGEAKYTPILNSIYSGLGVPPSLTGSAIGGFTNNATSLKTLIERLQYVRDVLVEFWSQEIKHVQLAKGFRFPAQIQFDRTILTDEAAEKNILLAMVDRNIISYESARERMGEIPELEQRRIAKEMRQRGNGTMPPQADGYHNANTDNELKKIALQTGVATPSEVGLELEETKPNEKTLLEHQTDMQVKILKNTPKPTAPPSTKKTKGKPGQGRPKNKKDSTKRKKKTVKPIRGVANIMAWAVAAQKQISDILTPALLHTYKKKNARMLTEAEANESENIKFRVLSQFEPNEIIDNETISAYLSEPLNVELNEIMTSSYKEFVAVNEKEPSFDELRSLQAASYVIWCMNNMEDDNV